MGKGAESLVVLTGLELENTAPTGAALWFLRLAYRRYGRHFTIYHVTARPMSMWAERCSALLRLLGKRLVREPDDPSDYVATIDADLRHDSSERLAEITAPTLVIGGTADYFFPDPILRETAERIPNAILNLYEGVGHPVVKSRRRDYERDVLEFLRGA